MVVSKHHPKLGLLPYTRYLAIQGISWYNIRVLAHFDATEWISQARRGTLELCVLTLISQKPYYGYQLVTHLSRWEKLAAPEGTLYPLLRRLDKDGYIVGQWQESGSGPPRKYYSLTETGEGMLFAMSSEWTGLTHEIEQLRENGGEPGELTESPE
jgi:PadR family transcriptional regulator PadR